jgi:hypothetical protein
MLLCIKYCTYFLFAINNQLTEPLRRVLIKYFIISNVRYLSKHGPFSSIILTKYFRIWNQSIKT